MARGSRLRAVAAALTLALALGAWLALRGCAGSRVEGTLESRSHSSERPLDAPERSRPESFPGSTDRAVAGLERAPPDAKIAPVEALAVCSSAGIELASVDLEVEPGRWQRRELEAGHCDVTEIGLPVRVRAPGHLPARARAGEETLVLEPDALFAIEAPGLRECARSIEPMTRFRGASPLPARLAEALAFGFTGPDRWAIAVDVEGIGAPFGELHTVEVDLLDAAGRLCELSFVAKPNARELWRTQCPPPLATAPLELEVVRPEGEPRGELEYRLFPKTSSNATDVLTELPQPWGKVVLQPGRRIDFEGRADARSDRIKIAGVPTGEPLLLVVRDRSSCAFARATLEHDGAPKQVALERGTTLAGRLSVPLGARMPARASLTWGRRAEDGKLEPFASELRGVPISADGGFEVRGPQRVAHWEEIAIEAPAVLGVELEAQGFELVRCSCARGAGTSYDCGTLALAPSEAAFVLAPGHGLDPADLSWKALVLGPRDVRTVRTVREEHDGALSLVLDEQWLARNDPRERPTQGERPPGIPQDAPALLLDLLDGRVPAFLRAPGGRYERVAEREYGLDVVCDPAPGTASEWRVGWAWMGLHQQLSRVRPKREIERRRLRFAAPIAAIELWWTSESGPESHSDPAGPSASRRAIESSSIVLELP